MLGGETRDGEKRQLESRLTYFHLASLLALRLLKQIGKGREDLADVVEELEGGVRRWCERNGEVFEEAEIEEVDIEDEDGENEDGEDEDDDDEDDCSDSNDGGSSVSSASSTPPQKDFVTSLAASFNSLPAPEATALFPAICMINHSCTPNVEIAYTQGNYTASIVATRDIEEGEEVCHCYVSLEEMPGVLERREHLKRQHMFLCECRLCEEQMAEVEGRQEVDSGQEENDGRAKKRRKR